MQSVLSPALTLDAMESVRFFLLSSVRFWSKARVLLPTKTSKQHLLFKCPDIKKAGQIEHKDFIHDALGWKEGKEPQMGLEEPGDTIQLYFSLLLLWLNSSCKRQQRQ